MFSIWLQSRWAQSAEHCAWSSPSCDSKFNNVLFLLLANREAGPYWLGEVTTVMQGEAGNCMG